LPVRSVFSDEKKLSMAALSQTLPGRLIEQTTPLSLELFAGVLAAAIGVTQQCIGLAAAPDRHHQGIGHELCGHLSVAGKSVLGIVVELLHPGA
jgi:hypothetical protein